MNPSCRVLAVLLCTSLLRSIGFRVEVVQGRHSLLHHQDEGTFPSVVAKPSLIIIIIIMWSSSIV